MANKLTKLCELQLYSILQEIGTSGADTTNAATRALSNCAALEEILAEHKSNLCANDALAVVKEEINKVIISLQFMDELSQRVSHVLQLFSIIKRSLNPEAELMKSDEDYLKIATKIFSMQAEFSVLQKLFPGCNHVSCNNDIELF